jgi:hypothetical protein
VDLSRLIPPQAQRDSPQDFELWPEHAMAWDVYLGCGTQWVKTVGLWGVAWEGFNYPGVEVVMRRYGVPPQREGEVFAQLQVLERETVKLLNQRQK